MSNGRFDNIQEIFEILNANSVKYLVLRNYENLLQPELFVGEHADIDMLCDNSQQVVNLLGAQSNRRNQSPLVGDGVHYYLIVNGQKVSFDLRQVGDGYYCEKWEVDLLRRRKKQACFYVMEDEDYFYTLAYHAILQKRQFSDEYRCRLQAMASDCGIAMDGNNERGFLHVLEQYMNQHGYQFTYSQDYLVPNRFGLVSNDLIQHDRKLWWKHKKFDFEVAVIEFLVRVKHLFDGLQRRKP